jgi:hypothetical protein
MQTGGQTKPPGLDQTITWANMYQYADQPLAEALAPWHHTTQERHWHRGATAPRGATLKSPESGISSEARPHLSTSKSGSVLIFSQAPSPCFLTPSLSAFG